ncbi:MAG: hypothetical protein WBF17_13320, partial [Phycisphaerae bacterium]
FQGQLMEMVKDVFGDMASWRHTKQENEQLRKRNFEQLARPETYGRQMAWIRKRLAERPELRTFFLLDGRTGKSKAVVPLVYSESMNGPCAPAVVAPDGKVIVKYQALLRSRYGAYSPLLNVGYLDTATGDIAPIMDQSRTYGWHDSLLLVHDEQCQLTVAGRVLLNTHQDNVNAMDLETLKGYGQPLARGIHEPKPGEAVAIWARLLGGRDLPPGKEWLARGTAVYGGGSVLDVPVVVSGDSMYYLPTHEINAGAAVIAFRMDPSGKGAPQSPAPQDKLNDEQWSKVRQMPWEWDLLSMRRLSHVPKALPGAVGGTREAPLTDAARAAVAKVPDAELDRIIGEVRSVTLPASSKSSPLVRELHRCVQEMISAEWRPLVFPAGKHPVESYRFFCEPTELLYTLARAYPYLGDDLQASVRAHVAELRRPGGPLEGPVGRKTFDVGEGRFRSLYDVPESAMSHVRTDILRCETARLYPVWLWAHVTGDDQAIRAHWPKLREMAGRPANDPAEDCHNGYVAGTIAAARMARTVGDDKAGKLAGVARQAMRRRLEYELAHTRGGLITAVPTLRTIFGRWRHLTPEVGRMLATHAGTIERDLMRTYVDYHRPAWYVAWNVELMLRNESPLLFPTVADEIFAARALILAEGQANLTRYVDIPWCKADWFHVRKLVLCIEAGGRMAWSALPGRRL